MLFYVLFFIFWVSDFVAHGGETYLTMHTLLTNPNKSCSSIKVCKDLINNLSLPRAWYSSAPACLKKLLFHYELKYSIKS